MILKKTILRPALITAVLLSIPFIGMQVSTVWAWSESDFMLMGIIIFSIGIAYELVANKAMNSPYKIAAGLTAITAFLLIWVNLAVGIIGEPGGPNMMYLGVLGAGLLGAAISNLESRGMSRTLIVMAVLQLLVPVFALFIAPSEVLNEPPGIYGVFLLNAGFAFFWAFAAVLFLKAGNE